MPEDNHGGMVNASSILTRRGTELLYRDDVEV